MGFAWLLRTPRGSYRFLDARFGGRGARVSPEGNWFRSIMFFADCELKDRNPDALRAVLELHSELAGMHLPIHSGGVRDLRDEQIRHLSEWLSRAVHGGQIVIEAEPPIRARVQRRNEIGPERRPAAPPPVEREAITWFEVVVQDEIGQVLAGVPLVFTAGEREESRTTDGGGKARLEDVTATSATVRFADEPSLRDALAARWRTARGQGWVLPPADVAHTVTVVRRRHLLPSASVGAFEPHVIILQPRVVLAKLFGMWFETSKCFLLPTAMDGVRLIPRLYAANPETDALIVGHTDTAGRPEYNDPLSLERARAVAAYLTDEVEDWLEWYGSGKPDEKRWGAREDAMMITAVALYSGLEIPPGQPLVTWFQETFSDRHALAVDGIAGPLTRRALITEYMAIDGTTLPKDVVPTTHGCGESFPLVASGDEQADVRNRRTEVFLFENPIAPPARPSALLPPPPGAVSGPGSPEYPEWVLRARETHENEAGKPVATGTLWLRFDILPPQALESRDEIRLFSSSRSYDSTKPLSVSHVANESSVDVAFGEVPTEDTYTLEIQPAEGGSYFVFQDRPYASLNDDGLPESATPDDA